MFKMLILLSCLSSEVFAAKAPAEMGPKNKKSSELNQSKEDLAQKLRAKIMADDQLSTLAHNVNIMTNESAITLKGEVANRAEKIKLENYARSMAGNLKVFNQLKYKR